MRSTPTGHCSGLLSDLHSPNTYAQAYPTHRPLDNCFCYAETAVHPLVTAGRTSDCLSCTLRHCAERPTVETSEGRQELRSFMVECIFPRLRKREDIWVEDDENTDTTNAYISQLYSYLHAVYVWLAHPPGHGWTSSTR